MVAIAIDFPLRLTEWQLEICKHISHSDIGTGALRRQRRRALLSIWIILGLPGRPRQVADGCVFILCRDLGNMSEDRITGSMLEEPGSSFGWLPLATPGTLWRHSALRGRQDARGPIGWSAVEDTITLAVCTRLPS